VLRAPSGEAAPPPTDEQRRAIEADPGPVLVVAGPGAGKTYCLINRIRFLISDGGVAPERIRAVTFTNKAADEIADRLGRELGPLGGLVERGTLHSLCLRLLREHPAEAGLESGFGVADEEYQAALLRRLRVREEQAQTYLTLFGRARLQGYRLEPQVEAVYQAYRGTLRRRNLVDFDDLIIYTHDLLERHPGLLAAVAGQWDAILVDEFQDLSPTQYAIVRRLATPHHHIFAVGDDEQSIYGWAGADPDILRHFQRDYGVEPVVLEVNHRNSIAIFEAARRVLRANPALFDKRLSASRLPLFPVRALGFRHDTAELRWLVQDFIADRENHGLAWGDFAVLYRTHRIGYRLESELLKAGVPVRMAQGRAVLDDPVAGPVLAAFRLIQSPDDSVPMEMLERRFLEPDTRELLRSQYGDQPKRTALRLFGRDKRMHESERRRAMRLYHHIENLAGLARSSQTLGDLVDGLLEQRPAERRTLLEERAEELEDPAVLPGVRALAERLELANEEGHLIHVRPCLGLELGLRGMLGAAGFDPLLAPEGQPPGPDDLVLDPVGAPGMTLRLFKAVQLLHASRAGLSMDDCVTFDLETTGNDPATCRTVEIGAVRVRGGQVVERFHQLVNPGIPIPADSTQVHGYTDADVAEQPSFTEVWPRLRQFIGSDLLVAHNARHFDLLVLRRQVRETGDELRGMPTFDTLPLARALVKGSASLSALAAHFGLGVARAHHALDDAEVLAQVLRGLVSLRQAHHRRTAFSSGLDWLGLCLVLERGERTAEEMVLLDVARVYTLGRYTECLEQYDAMRRRSGRVDTPPVEDLIDRLGGRDLMLKLRARRTAAERFPTSVARLDRLLEGLAGLPVDEGIRQALDLVALSQREGMAPEQGSVSLLTLHATKGLEFSRVYVVGVEDHQLPGRQDIQNRRDEMFPEARRLLYVGMTRARDRLVLTRVAERAGKPTGGTMFLDEMGLALEPIDD
jgi:DNA polymerase III epsilon subunit family exonuclease